MIHYIHDDITKSQCDIICHQVNCQGVMNSGVAKAIREKWPEVYEQYREDYEYAVMNNHPMLGNLSICTRTKDGKIIVNMFAQEFYGYSGQKFTSYDAFWSCLMRIKQWVKDDQTLAFPLKIGSDRGGAKWPVIRTMIEQALYDKEVYIYYLNEWDLDNEDRRKAGPHSNEL